MQTDPVRPTCNICGGNAFRTLNGRENARCAKCLSFERTRVMKLLMDRAGIPKTGAKTLHIAPEPGLAKYLQEVCGENYRPVDLDSERYAFCKAEKFDLTTDAEELESGIYDLVIHSHVMEHIPCDETAVLLHLHRSLNADGVHIVSIPIFPGYYGSDLKPLSADEAIARFHQFDHVRRFGLVNLAQTFGMVFKLPATYDIVTEFGEETLRAHAIPEAAWRGFSGHSVFLFRKGDCKFAV